MKKILFSACLLGLVITNLQAQTVKIKAIPYPLHSENAPSGYEVTGDNELKIAAPANTDLFTSLDGVYEINKSPRLIFRPDSDFILTAKIKPEFKAKWDAGVLLIYNDAKHYAKFCFEKDFTGQSRVVSVVCNDISDDCNSMAINSPEVYYRIAGSSKGNSFNLYYSADGKSWFPVRSFRLNKTDKLSIGLSSQSPVGNGCEVNFSDIDLQQRKLRDTWLGN